MDFENCDDYKKLLTNNHHSIIRHNSHIKCHKCGYTNNNNNVGDLVEAVGVLRRSTSDPKIFAIRKPKSIAQKIGSWFKCCH